MWVLYANGKLTNNQPSVIGTSKGLACADFAYRGLSAFLFHIQIITYQRKKIWKAIKLSLGEGGIILSNFTIYQNSKKNLIVQWGFDYRSTINFHYRAASLGFLSKCFAHHSSVLRGLSVDICHLSFVINVTLNVYMTV